MKIPNKRTLVQPIRNVLYKRIIFIHKTFTLYINMDATHEEYTVEGNIWWGVGKTILVIL